MPLTLLVFSNNCSRKNTKEVCDYWIYWHLSDTINICPFQIIFCKKELELIAGVITFIFIIFNITKRWKMGFLMCQCLWAEQDKSWVMSAYCRSFPQKKLWVMLHTWFTEIDLTYCIPNSSSPFLSFCKRKMLCFSMWIISLCANHRINEIYRPISSSATPLLCWCTHYSYFVTRQEQVRRRWLVYEHWKNIVDCWLYLYLFLNIWIKGKKTPKFSEVFLTADFYQN